MANIIDVLTRYIRPYYYRIIAVVVCAIFLYAIYYAYNTFYIKPRSQKQFSDVANANRRSKEATVLFFHVDWCPHCKTALPDWNAFKSQYNGKEMNGYTINCVDMNCTEETSDIARAINKYNIESYPTIKLLKDDQTIEFDSKITSTSLEKFVNTMLSN
jgi:thiol-disulfide isomerase/thioredoxin